MAEIKIVDDKGKIVEPDKSHEPVEGDTVTIPVGVFLTEQVRQMFNMGPNEVVQYKRNIGTLIEYAKMKTNDHSAESIKWIIRRLGTKLGTPPLGEKPVSYLSRFAYLELQGQKVKEEQKRFLNANN